MTEPGGTRLARVHAEVDHPTTSPDSVYRIEREDQPMTIIVERITRPASKPMPSHTADMLHAFEVRDNPGKGMRPANERFPISDESHAAGVALLNAASWTHNPNDREHVAEQVARLLSSTPVGEQSDLMRRAGIIR